MLFEAKSADTPPNYSSMARRILKFSFWIISPKETNAQIKVIAGNYKEISAPEPAPDSWAANTENEVAIWNIHIDAHSTFILPKALNQVTRNLYFYEGSEIEIENQKMTLNHGASLDPAIDITINTSKESAHFILLQGKPIAEPVVQHGPFVMNTQEEIRATMKDYQLTQFGGWPWPHADNVHDRKKGRFAKYPDGTIVEKE